VRTWFRLGLVVLAVVLGARAFVQRAPVDAVAQPPLEVTAGQTAASVVTDALLSGEERSRDEMSWQITQANTADDVMVMDIEADRPDEARTIAQEIVPPLADAYLEVLIYVRGRAGSADGNVRRVHWTPDLGYVETTYSDQ